MKDAAEQLGIRRETLSRWKSEYGFQQELQRTQNELREARMARLGSAFDKAFDVLEGLLESENERIALRAAGTIAQTAAKVSASQEPVDIERAMSEQEARAELERLKEETLVAALESGDFPEEENALLRKILQRSAAD